MLSTAQREANYRRQTGRRTLTPRQLRNIRRKENQAKARANRSAQ